jgi:transposase-like protein
MSPRFSTLAASVLLSPVQARRRAGSPPSLRLLTNNPPDGPPSQRLHATRRRVPPMALLPVAYRGSYLRRLLAPRRPVEHALLSVIQQTYLTGSSTRTVDALAESVGVPGIDPVVVESQASDWDLRVEAFRQRPLREAYPYLMLVETPVLVREAGEAQTCQIVVAVGMDETGFREVVGLAIRPAGSLTTFWEIFLGDLKERGLTGLRLVTSNRLPGLLPSLAAVFPGVPWQRCRESFIADAVHAVPKDGRPAVEAGLRAAFAEPDATTAIAALGRVRDRFAAVYPELAAALEVPLAEPLTYYQVARAHRRLVTSLTGLASLQNELRQSCQLVGIFPHRQALLRLAGTIVQEISEEWAARPLRLRRQARTGEVTSGSAPVTWGSAPVALASAAGLPSAA